MGKLIRFVLLVAIVLGVAGYFLGWYHVEKGDKSFTVTLDEEKLQKDLESGKAAAKDVVEKGKEVTSDLLAPDVKGTIAAISKGDRSMTVTTAKNGDVSVRADDGMSVTLNGATASFSDLRKGDTVEIVTASLKGEKIAKSVVATRS